jgi:hypothetical protein
VHLKVAAVVFERHDIGNVERQQADHLGAAEEAPAQHPALNELLLASARSDSLLDGRRVSMFEHLVDDARRGGTDPMNAR